MLTQGPASDPKCKLNISSFLTLPHQLDCNCVVTVSLFLSLFLSDKIIENNLRSHSWAEKNLVGWKLDSYYFELVWEKKWGNDGGMERLGVGGGERGWFIYFRVWMSRQGVSIFSVFCSFYAVGVFVLSWLVQDSSCVCFIVPFFFLCFWSL